MIIKNKTFDEERALYASNGIEVVSCSFDGPADGESALKESKNVCVKNCFCNLRYPFWHDKNIQISDSELTEKCRAALWYSEDIVIKNCKLHGIKALRECKNTEITDCDIVSPEFGWNSGNIAIKNTLATGEYFMFRATDLRFSDFTLKGKYSYQYIKNSEFENCVFDTKDAFWHAENVVVRNSVVNGEYLAWYADNIVFENCKISGTQPFCYTKNLVLKNCEMTSCDLAFEKTSVNATVTTHIDSIKNPLSGVIFCPSVGEIIMDDENAKGIVKVEE